jgi:hypothetical protein
MKKNIQRIICSLLLAVSMTVAPAASAVAQSTQSKNGTAGIQGTIPSPPPKTAATIASPSSGRTFQSTPIDVNGLCTTGLLVKLFSNNIFVGAVQCEKGSYSIKIDLFGGENTLIARVYDSLDQAGPDSNSVTVTFQDATFAAFAARMSLTSNYAKKGADVGAQLTWPIVISGGTAPYALSVDWGDGSATDLRSVSFAGTYDLTHTYKTAGIYAVIVKGTDKAGSTAFLQLVGVGNGEVTQGSSSGSSNGGSNSSDKTYIYIWWPVVLLIPFAIVAFWVGRRFEVVAIHRRIEKQAAMYQNEIQR